MPDLSDKARSEAGRPQSRNGKITVSHLRRPIEGIAEPYLDIIEDQPFVFDPDTGSDSAGKAIPEQVVVVPHPPGIAEQEKGEPKMIEEEGSEQNRLGT